MPGTAEEFARLLHETARVWRHTLDRRLRPLGLSQAKWLALVHLARADTGLTQKELAARLGIEGATLVGLIDRLHADGWVERREVLHDRRCKTVHLTDGAQPVLREITRAATELRTELLGDVRPEELQYCIGVLDRIRLRAGAMTHPEDDGDAP